MAQPWAWKLGAQPEATTQIWPREGSKGAGPGNGSLAANSLLPGGKEEEARRKKRGVVVAGAYSHQGAAEPCQNARLLGLPPQPWQLLTSGAESTRLLEGWVVREILAGEELRA